MNGMEEADELQVVVFSVAGHEFGIYITGVREIIALSKLVALPNMPPAMVGIINVRGTVLPILDLKNRFGLGSSSVLEGTSQRILVVEYDGSLVGYLVDAVSEVLRVTRDSLEQVDRIQGMKGKLVDSICKVEDRLIPIINITTLMTDQEVLHLQQAAKERAVYSGI
ncbi:MAG TPA: purine-binding chemotaxis protein CheW [Firmicutes bacterium]|jgi:purine-binding chemotaxis protein CheW|nr:purine-binding chemotaxis protein CheW [Bacillota bacterium]